MIQKFTHSSASCPPERVTALRPQGHRWCHGFSPLNVILRSVFVLTKSNILLIYVYTYIATKHMGQKFREYKQQNCNDSTINEWLGNRHLKKLTKHSLHHPIILRIYRTNKQLINPSLDRSRDRFATSTTAPRITWPRPNRSHSQWMAGCGGVCTVKVVVSLRKLSALMFSRIGATATFGFCPGSALSPFTTATGT